MMSPEGFGAPGIPPFGPEQELHFLKSQADMMRQQLDQIEARVNELESTGEAS
jgi:hypothetical protein